MRTHLGLFYFMEITKFNQALDSVKSSLDILKEEIQNKREWLEENSEKYQESEKGEELATYLDDLEDWCNSVDDINLELSNI